MVAGYLESSIPTPTYKELRIGGIYEAVYLLEGEGRFQRSDGFEQTVRAGDLMLIFPEFRHSYGGGNKHWKEMWIWYDSPDIERWRQANLLNPSYPILHLEPIPYWQSRVEPLIRPPHWLDATTALARYTQLLHVLADAFQHIELNGLGLDSRRWIEEACAWIREHATGGAPDWSPLTTRFDMSYESFRRKFTQLAGVSPARYRMQEAMNQAAQMLYDPDRKISEVAEAAGYYDPFHFSHKFKKVMGVSPSAFRQRLFG